MKRTRKILLLAALPIVLAILAGAVWIFPKETLQHLVRPALETMAGSALEGEVSIGGLAPVEGGLLLTNVSLHREDGSLAVVIPEAEVRFTFAGLLDRRLERVSLVRPDLSLAPTGEEERPSFPEEPPLQIETLEIRDGGIRIRMPDGPVLFHGIDIRTRGIEPIDFHLTAFAGEGRNLPFLLDGALLWQEGLSITLEEFQWQENSLLASPLNLHLPTEAEAAAEGALRFERLDSEQLEAVFTALRMELSLSPEDHFTLFSPSVDFGWEKGMLRLQGGFDRGIFRRGDRELSLGSSSWMLAETEERWVYESRFALAEEVTGEVRGTFSDAGLTGSLLVRIPDPGALVAQIAGGSRPPISGGLRIQGDFISGPAFRFEGSFEGMPGEKLSEHLLDVSSLSGPLSLEKDEDSWSGRAEVRMDGRDIAEVRAEGGEITLAIRNFSGRAIHKILGPAYRRAIPDGAERVRAELRLLQDGKEWTGSAEILAGRLPLPKGTLEKVRLSGRFHPGEESIRFTRLRLVARLAGEGVPTGELSASGSGKWGGGKWLLRFDDLSAEEMDYLSAGGDSGFTGGRLRASGSVSGSAGGDSIALDLSGTLSMKEVLYGTFYAELSDLPGKWSLRGMYEPADALLQAEKVSFGVEKIGSLNVEGRIAPGANRSRGRLRLERLGEEFSRIFLPALQERFAAAKGLAVSGAVETEFALESGPEGWHARGTAFPEGLDLSLEFLEARGLEGSVPFDIFTGVRVPGVSGEKRTGTLSFTALSLGPAQFERNFLEIASFPNRIEIPGPTSFRVAKGQLEIEGASFGRGEEGPEFSAKIDIRDIDLEALTRELDWIGMRGRLDADLGRIHFAGDTLASEGNMVIEVFDGIVLVSGIRLESPFSAYPLLLGSVDFSGIDLFQLTRTFSFGAINGIADGFVHDLRLFRFTPSRFEAVLETPEKGTRNISVKALENLTVISQGGLSGALSRGIFRFIDFYRYRKIGIWCILRQDVFVLRGTAREGSERYLVYGGLMPPKIDILAPQHAISFKEMLNRLQRIERAEDAEN